MNESPDRNTPIFPENPHKTYGLMALIKGRQPVVEKSPEDTVPTWPNLIFKELTAAILGLVVLTLVSLLFNAPLEELANPRETPNPAKAPWYFLGFQEMVHYSAVIGGIIIPGLGALLLICLPYLDPSPVRELSKRKPVGALFAIFALANFILIIIGTYFRGPGWSFVVPW